MGQFCDQTHCRPSVIMKLLLLATCLAYANADGHDGMEHGTIVEELIKAGATQLVDFVEAAGLAETLPGAVTSDMIGNDKVVPTVEGSIHRVNVYLKSDYYDGFVTVNGKRLKKFDIQASNG